MKKMKVLLSAAAFMALLNACVQRVEQTASYEDVIPQPQLVEVQPDGGDFCLNGKTVIVYPAENDVLKTDAEHLRGYIEQLTGHNLKITDKNIEKDAIVLHADLDSDNPEGYVITVTPDLIDINGTTASGTFYGIQTIRKSIPQAVSSNVRFPAVTITDEPRFAYRGAHLDICRHFFPTDSVKTFIDMLALHNINTFHWHLSEDQGWRIEIKSRPLLTEIGSKRPGTIIGRTTEYDSIPVEGFYTQDDVRDIIKYAADRHITIIPEIDMPGHMLAALAGYPELGCTGGPYEVWRRWGVSEDVLCAGNDSTYAFIDDVLGEICDLFPSEYIHVGGDECPKVRWKDCPKCQAKIVALGFKDDKHGTKEEKLQSHVIRHASEFLTGKGKKMIGWDETLEGGLAPGAIVMSWRGEKGGIEAAKQGHDVIMTPNVYMYFDYYQTRDQDNEPLAIGGYVPLEKVYGYEPVTDVFTPEEAAHIIGVQANLWTEFIPTFSQVQYMELPRMAALSEVQWSSAPKDYASFIKRVPQMMRHYKANGYNYSTRAFDIDGDLEVDTDNHTVAITLNTADDAPIFYTLDGSIPTAESTPYSDKVVFDKSGVLKAVAIRTDGSSRIYVDSVSFNKATAHKVSLETAPRPNYTCQGGATLVDGHPGGKKYSAGGWLGYNGADMVAVVDLEEPQQIGEVAIRTNVNTDAWIFNAQSLTVDVSDDGSTWRTVASEKYPVIDKNTVEIQSHTLTFDPVSARYVKVTAESLKSVPEWHVANGKPAFLFVDEIILN